MSTIEEHKLLFEWNRTKTDYPREEPIHELFDEQSQRTREAIAVSCGDGRLTYGELKSRANQLAHYLQEKGVGPEVMVGICMERGLEMVVGILAILKAGGAYLPLDPDFPQERLRFMLQDSRAALLLTMSSMKGRLPAFDGQIISLDSDQNRYQCEAYTNPFPNVSSTNLAYVIYTSGSTGEPKGVAVPHHAVIRLVCNTDYLQVQPQDRVAQASNASFDAATLEVWGALVHGAQLVGVAHEVMLNPRAFADFV